MPILPAEPAVYPSDLLQDSQQPERQDRRWYVMHTRPQQEKSLARELRRDSVPYYLPQISRRKRYGRRVLTSHLPLFPGYISVFASEEERLASLESRRIARTLDVPDQRRFLKDIQQIAQLVAADVPLTPEARLAPGDRVRIRSGLLAGLEGVVWRTDSGRRFVVTVDFLQRGASVVAEDFDLAVLN